MTPLIPALAGGLVAIGILGIVLGLLPTTEPPREKRMARGRRVNLTGFLDISCHRTQAVSQGGTGRALRTRSCGSPPAWWPSPYSPPAA